MIFKEWFILNMENNCYFVSSRGILKSCDFQSPNPRSSWCYDTNYLTEMVNSVNMFDGMSVYVCTDVLEFFVDNILPEIKHNFFLVTGDSDATVPNGGIDIYHNFRRLKESVCYRILEHPRLIKWFSQNCIFTVNNVNTTDYKISITKNCDKITQLPIGLDYHTVANDPSKFWRAPNEGFTSKYQEMLLKNIRSTMKPFDERIPKIFVQMSLGGPECIRRKAIEAIPKDLIELNNNKMYRTDVWKEIIKYTFALSPYGDGPDCYRTWEILCLGGIPIVRSFGSNEMFKDLPVLVVDEWNQVTQELLTETVEKFSKVVFNYDKLSLRYWTDQFNL